MRRRSGCRGGACLFQILHDDRRVAHDGLRDARRRSRGPAPRLGSLPQMVLAKATAVSHIRLEKPHSLSYQDRTRTSLPSTTWVCVASNVELNGEWLKSQETSSSSL